MERRRLLAAIGTAGLAGCTAGGDASDDCTVGRETELVETLPPAPDGFEQTEPTDGSEASREEFSAAAMVVTDYRDADDETLDDYTVRVVRFQPDADGEQVLAETLTSVATDSGREGVAAVVGRVGFLALGPTRSEARSLLTDSPELSADCFEQGRVTAARTPTA